MRRHPTYGPRVPSIPSLPRLGSTSVTPQPEIFTVNFTGKTGADFEVGDNPAKSYLFSVASPPSTDTYYQWFFVDGDTATDPSSGSVGVETDINDFDTASDLASAAASAINTQISSSWTAVAVGSIMTVTAASNGARQDAADIDTGLTITTTQQGAP